MIEETTAEEKPKAASIRGNLKLIKELRADIDNLLAHISLNEIKNNELNEEINELSSTEYLPNTNIRFNTKLENIEKCIAKMAHYNGGNSPRICREFGIAEYKVKLKDMSKFG